MNSKKAKKIATWIIVPLMASIFILDIVTVVAGNILAKRYMPSPENGSPRYSDDRIHFLNTANSDCILLESNGHFALVDSGEGDSNPRRKTAYHGYEEQVLAYLKSAAVSSDGKVRLDFILGTHYHYDHVGCFDRIINDDDIIIKKAYFKKHNPEIDHDYEIEKWRLGDIYETIINDLKKKNIPLEQNIPDKIKFGDFELTLYNTGYYDDLKNHGENAASIGIKAVKGEKSAFLAADITKTSGLEKKLGEKIGHCDLLKAGHHGYYGSSSMSFLKYIKPEVTIIPNMQGKVYPNVKWNLTMFAHTPFYGTYDYNGIIASFTDDGRIILTNDIHREEL
ncbi:MAG: MBL fold metallo-hydrolase [Clostridia bacterium]|nr:MBL fold metallo-hydrolase [Clostridia bacterium]